jgi:alkanesulfonate monooxygenase SsuD/methylene tetrahydromethanopterin reductase-like flavin-dependent oxidoreductase (luciferase family)
VPAEHPWVTQPGPRFGANIGAVASWPQICASAQTLEAAGFDAIFVPDHPLLMGDAWTTLAGLAEATKRVRLGTMVSCVSYRHPVVLARIASDVDRISGGRVVLGVGSGDMPWEFERLGLDYGTGPQRLARLAEALAIIEPLLAGETVAFEGEFYRVRDAALSPRPVQDPIPILIAGGGPGTLRLTAKHAHASNLGAASWAGGAFTAADITERWSRLRAGCDEVGRDFDSVLRTGLINLTLAKTREQAEEKVGRIPPQLRSFLDKLVTPCTPPEAIKHVQALLDAGYQYIVFQGMDPETIDLMATEVLPRFRQAATV